MRNSFERDSENLRFTHNGINAEYKGSRETVNFDGPEDDIIAPQPQDEDDAE